jgi:hypothetical protein
MLSPREGDFRHTERSLSDLVLLLGDMWAAGAPRRQVTPLNTKGVSTLSRTPLVSGIPRWRALISILKNTFDPAEFSAFLLN